MTQAHMARARGFDVHIISREFNHGGTRQLGIGLLPEADIIVFLTQDALARPDPIERLDAFKRS